MPMNDARPFLTRRAFLGRSALATGGTVLSLSALGRLDARLALAASGRDRHGNGYGPLAPVTPSNGGDIAAAGFPDLAAFPILALPHGFHYRAFSIIGGVLSDGNPVPVNHDGMAAFAHPTELEVVRLIRNQEDRSAPGLGSVLGPAETRYDPLGRGGNVTLDYDERRHGLVQDYVSLNGTIVNCAGGIGFGSQAWLTCEETTAGTPPWGQPHGYVFAVPLNVEPGELQKAVPQMQAFADVRGVQVSSIGSQDMNDEVWIKLANEVNKLAAMADVDGVATCRTIPPTFWPAAVCR